jgi:hypothetical protein
LARNFFVFAFGFQPAGEEPAPPARIPRPVILSEAKNLSCVFQILRCAQDDKAQGRLSAARFFCP